MKLRKTLAGVGAAAAVFAGSVLVAVPAIAQDDTSDGVTEDSTFEPHHHRRSITKFAAVADALGIDLDELRERLRNEETIADIAAAEGVAIDDVIDALVGEAEAHLTDAVADERLTQEEADERLVDIEERVTELVNGEIEWRRGGFGGPRGIGPGLDAVTELLGMDAEELSALLREGAPLADIAAEQGVAVEDLTEAMLAPAVEHLSEHVAEGDLTQEEADARLADITERIDDLVNGELRGRGRGLRGPGSGHGGGGFGTDSSDIEDGATN